MLKICEEILNCGGGFVLLLSDAKSTMMSDLTTLAAFEIFEEVTGALTFTGRDVEQSRPFKIIWNFSQATFPTNFAAPFVEPSNWIEKQHDIANQVTKALVYRPSAATF